MKKIKIIYWSVIKGMHEGLGYSFYLIPFVGVAKVLGIIAILIPGFRENKDGLAGLFFDLVGATFSIYSSGERGANLAFMLMPILPGAYLICIIAGNKAHRKTNLSLHDQHQQMV